jgi:hypothetical protein
MRPTHPRSFRAQADLLRRQFLQDGGLPFTDILTMDVLSQAAAALGSCCRLASSDLPPR